MSSVLKPYSSPKAPARAVLYAAHHTSSAVMAGTSGLKEDSWMSGYTLYVAAQYFWFQTQDEALAFYNANYPGRGARIEVCNG